MAIANYLQSIKAAGLYRFVFDKSQLPAVTQESLRLVVGYSEKGPFNTPVYIESESEFKKVFGDISKKLERYGDFFHRSALQALEAGPIYALNIKNFNHTVPTEQSNPEAAEGYWPTASEGDPFDTVKGVTFSANTVPADKTYNVEDIYDISRFWYLEPKYLHTTSGTNNYMFISATDSRQMSNSIFIRAYKPSGFNITFKDWYATVMNGEELPSYLEGHESEKLEDYFVKIYVFKGNLTDPEIQKTFKPYFNIGDTDTTPVNIEQTVPNAFGEDVDALDQFTKNSKSNFVNVYSGIIFPEMVNSKGLSISIDSTFNADNSTHKMMMYLDTDKLYDTNWLDTTTNNFTDTFKMTGDNSKFYKGTDDTWSLDAVKPIYVPGFVYKYSKPKSNSSDDKKIWQSVLFGSLKGLTGTAPEGYKGLRIALTDRKSIAYHYLVDTFESYITKDAFPKAIFTNICKEKQNALALINFPKAQEFKDYKSSSTGGYDYFTGKIIDFPKVVKDCTTLTNGLYSLNLLPDEENGAAYCSVNTCVIVQNPATRVKTAIPSAALVSNCFMEKYISRLPYDIVAGPNYAKIKADNLIGPDYIYSEDDLFALEPFGVNCMVYVPKRGTFINSNQTAKQNPETALSKLHIMELVIFLQDEIEDLLQSYQWEKNTQTLRDKVKKKADVILETCKNNDGIGAYISQCDEKNNTVEVIENEMLILDYAIEPTWGAGKMVQQLTVYRTGGISSATISQ